MQPLQINALLSTPFVAYDNWSPSLDNLLIWLLLDRAGLSVTMPTPEVAKQNQSFIEDNLPLAIGYLEGEWYHQVSSPHYQYDWETITKTHKAWNRQDQHLDWKGKRRIWITEGFHTKSRVNLLPERSAPRIDWFCIGDPAGIQQLLNNCNHLGKQKRGQVIGWQIYEIENDLHLWGPGEQLMRPIPMQFLPDGKPHRRMKWGWRSPIFLPENIAECALPVANVVNFSS